MPAELMEGALELDKVYIPARHPDAHPSGAPRDRYTRREAQRLISNAESIVKFGQGLLSGAEPGG